MSVSKTFIFLIYFSFATPKRKVAKEKGVNPLYFASRKIVAAVVIRDGRALANRYFCIYQHALGAVGKLKVNNDRSK